MHSTPTLWIEQWKRIQSADWPAEIHIEISSFGRIKSFKTNSLGKIIRGSNIQNYNSLNIRYQGCSINRYVHKLVAEHFLPNQDAQAIYVIHRDFDKKTTELKI